MMSSPQEATAPSPPAQALPNTSGDAPRRGHLVLKRLTFAAAIGLVLAYVAFFALLKSLPLQDFPNHLARAHILDDLLFNGGAHFGSEFTVHLAAIPYLLHDLLLTGLVHVLGTTAGASVFITIVLLSLPAALWLYMRACGLSPRIQLPVLLLSVVLSTDWFFLMGFLAFRLAIALVIVSLAMAESLRTRWSLTRYAAYVLVLLAGYLTHLSTPVFFAAVIGVSAATRLFFRTSVLGREALLVLPAVAIVLLHMVWPHALVPGEHAQYFYESGRLSDKLLDSTYELSRFGGRVSELIIGLLVLCVLLGCWRALRPTFLREPRVAESLLVAGVFVGLYLLLPRDYADAAYVDIRALVMVLLFVLIGSAWLSHAQAGTGYGSLGVRVLVLGLVAMNLGWIAVRMKPLEHWLTDYRQLAHAVPERARVLPVSTLPKIGLFSPFLHAGSYLVLDRNALIPYLFSGTSGDPMKYFTYRQRPYMPHESWYLGQQKWEAAVPATYSVLGEQYTWRFQYSETDRVWEPALMVPVDWARVACDYEWLLVTKPYDSRFIGVTTHLEGQNDSAALFAIDKSACRPSPSKGPVRLRTEH